MREEARLTGKVAVVTGGGRGIGRAAAILLARAGASVVVAARTLEQVEETAKKICSQNRTAIAIPADVSDWPSVEQLREETVRWFGLPDIVVVNASVLKPVGDAWTVSPEEWASNLNINLTGAFYTVRAFLPGMIERGNGILIFVSSGAATHPVPGWSAYCAAKSGLDHLVRNLAAEIDQRGLAIRVHTLYPGVADTSMQEEIRRVPAEQFPLVKKYLDYNQKGWLRPPEEPAVVIWWLATPMAADFAGQAVSIDALDVRQRVAKDLELEPFKGRGG